MKRHWLAFAAASAFAATPVFAQEGPPPPGWAASQAPHYPTPRGEREGSDAPGAPFAHRLPPGAYPDRPEHHPHAPMAWRGEEGAAAAYGYPYGYGPAAAPCGCPGYGVPVMWVPIPIQTHYLYSEPTRHVDEVVEERTVEREVVESRTVPVHRATKYVKTAPPKLAKGKVVRTTK